MEEKKQKKRNGEFNKTACMKSAIVIILLLSLAYNVIVTIQINRTMKYAIFSFSSVYRTVCYEMTTANYSKEACKNAVQKVIGTHSSVKVFNTFKEYPLIGKRYDTDNLLMCVLFLGIKKYDDMSVEQQEDTVELIKYLGDAIGKHEILATSENYNFISDPNKISKDLKNIEIKCEDYCDKWD